MRKLALIAVFAIGGSLFALGQESTPQAEIFGGYSLLHADNGFVGNNASGWEASLAGNYNRWLGLTADFSGHYDSFGGVDVSDHNFLFGPTVSLRNPRFTPFGHALFGDSHISAGGVSDNSFGMALGGGLDWNLTQRFAVRVIQADYLFTHFGGDTQNNIRFSFGLVLRLGSK